LSSLVRQVQMEQLEEEGAEPRRLRCKDDALSHCSRDPCAPYLAKSVTQISFPLRFGSGARLLPRRQPTVAARSQPRSAAASPALSAEGVCSIEGDRFDKALTEGVSVVSGCCSTRPVRISSLSWRIRHQAGVPGRVGRAAPRSAAVAIAVHSAPVGGRPLRATISSVPHAAPRADSRTASGVAAYVLSAQAENSSTAARAFSERTPDSGTAYGLWGARGTRGFSRLPKSSADRMTASSPERKATRAISSAPRIARNAATARIAAAAPSGPRLCTSSCYDGEGVFSRPPATRQVESVTEDLLPFPIRLRERRPLFALLRP
jgi:hypothetical protein